MKIVAYAKEVIRAHKTMNIKILLLLVLFAPLLSACGDKPVNYRGDTYYVDKAKFAKGRPCVEVLFKCLPESQDKGWHEQKQTKENTIDFFELTPEVNAQFKKVREKWNRIYEEKSMNPYVIDAKDKAWMDEVERKRFLKEMEESLEKEFPDFWRDVPKPVRYRWLRRAITKAHKYGYEGERTDSIAMIELCARIGLDFDLDSKWEAVTKFITLPDGPLLNYASEAIDYIDFTVFEKNRDYTDTYNFTSWSLQTALRYLPYPKQPIPSLK